MASLYVDPDEVRPMVEGTAHGNLTLREAERALKMSTKVVKSLITEGLLATVSARNPVRRQSQRVVTPHALAELRLDMSLSTRWRKNGESPCRT